jgi:pyruvate, orthophosphate dikinase
MRRFVYDFTEGNRHQADLLGGKGANLAEMTRLGLPVPAGFTVSTEACRAYLETGFLPAGLVEEVTGHLRRIETTMGRRFGDLTDPLLLSVRSGARFSMPGMMETILDIGLNDVTVDALAVATGDRRFAWDSYRRLVQMYGRTVRGIPAEEFEHALAEARHHAGVRSDAELSSDALRHLVDRYQKIYLHHTGEEFPQDPMQQLLAAIGAVFASWHTERARTYRHQEHISESLGTAVNVMAMVFGNRGPRSGTGVAFTRDPATGARGCYGDYLANAQGEDVVSGVRNAIPLQELASLDRAAFDELMAHMSTLEHHYRDLCDIEFTIEEGRLWMLQTRIGKRTAAAAFIIAAQLAEEGLIDPDEALRRVSGAQLAQLMFPAFDLSAAPAPLATGVPASPGAATGRVVFHARDAVAAAEPVILVRRETSPDDLPGMIAAVGILTSRGGKTSHAAVVARGMGKTCVCGLEAIEVDEEARQFTVAGTVVREGDLISIDGTTGSVYGGALAVTPSPVVRFFEGELPVDADPLVTAVGRLLRQADRVRRLDVHANADTAADAERARRFGATGIGLCRTEHMFLGDRRVLVERVILATTEAEREAALQGLLTLQRGDFVGLLAAMDGLPVTIRLLDPPLHEFLPALEELTARVVKAEALGLDPGPDRILLDSVRRMHEQNPMLGLRGVRLGLVIPGLYAMQVRALAEATQARVRAGGQPRPEIMVPLVAEARELAAIRAEIEAVLAEIDHLPDIPIGTMIETPRAALTAHAIAAEADFFSFGTNDLTQMTWGFSRDDVEGAFLPAYLRQGILDASPFESIDPDGVGHLVRLAVNGGRRRRPELPTGVCGEHGGDPASVRFFHDAGLDYVSCSPFRVPVARLEAGRAAVLGAEESGPDSR